MKRGLTLKTQFRLIEQENLENFPKYRRKGKPVSIADVKKFKKGDNLKIKVFNFHFNKWKTFTFKFDKIKKHKNTVFMYGYSKYMHDNNPLHFDKLGNLRTSESLNISPVYFVSNEIKRQKNPRLPTQNPNIVPSDLGPLDYTFMKEIGIGVPIGFPDDPDMSSYLGSLLGEKYILELCGSYPEKIDYINKKCKRKFPQFNYVKSNIRLSSLLPSEAFQHGILSGIYFGTITCKAHSVYGRENLLKQINDSIKRNFPDVVYTFTDITVDKMTRTKSFLKSYFGL